MKLEIAVVLPTYNARNTIVQMVHSILREVDNSIVIVIDDNSPDKTAQLVKDNFSTNKRVLLVIRKDKGGRGSAVIRGFQEGLQFPSVKYFVEMDADLCHSPKFISSMVNATKNADVVIASRYLKKSKNINWKLKRKLFSLMVSSFLRLTLCIPITDYTNGFRCYKRKVIESLDFYKVKSKGFIVLSEIAYYIHELGFRFAEVPTTLKLYELNQSNLKFSEIKEAILTIIRLKSKCFKN